MKPILSAFLALSIVGCGNSKPESTSSLLSQTDATQITIALTYTYAPAVPAPCQGPGRAPCSQVKQIPENMLQELQSKLFTCAWVKAGEHAFQVTCPADCVDGPIPRPSSWPSTCPGLAYGNPAGTVISAACAPPADASATSCEWDPTP
jgi:hypothetical protein